MMSSSILTYCFSNLKWLFIISAILFTGILFAQDNSTTPKENKTVSSSALPANVNTAVREEIQRYMGYEVLPARYLSLPYDSTMNTNVGGNFIDITFLLLMLIPVFFLLGYRENPIGSLIFMVICSTLFIISLANTSIYTFKKDGALQEMATSQELKEYAQATDLFDAPSTVMLVQIKRLANWCYTPFDYVFNSFSGDRDFITYPILLLLFIGGFFIIESRTKQHSIERRALFLFIYFYSFLWLLLTAGIIWYGYLMIALGIPVCIYPLTQLTSKTSPFQKGLFWATSGILVLWLAMMVSYRFSNYIYKSPNTKEQLFDTATIQYQTGEYSKQDLLNHFFPNFDAARQLINKEDTSLVYRVGTVLPFFIKKNDRRVLIDNQLGLFNQLLNRYQKKYELTMVFRESGFRYILYDLRTASIDQTPEKTLTQKNKSFLQFLYQNEYLELIGTNRKIRLPDGREDYEVFGNEIIDYGTFAIYRIK